MIESDSENFRSDNLSFSSGRATCSDADLKEREEAEKLRGKARKLRRDKSKEIRRVVKAKRMKRGPPSTDHESSAEETEVWAPKTLVVEAPQWEGDLAVFIQLSIHHPALKMKTKRTPARTLIKASNQATEAALLSMDSLNGTPVKFRAQGPVQTSTGVVMRVPLAVPAGLLKAMDATTADRMTVWDAAKREVVETTSVKIVVESPLPDSIQIGHLGTFAVRRYNPDPICCYRCQRFADSARIRVPTLFRFMN